MDAEHLAAWENEHRAVLDALVDPAVLSDQVRLREVSRRHKDLEARTDDDGEAPAPISWLSDAEAEPSQVLERRAADWLQGEGVRQALESLDARSRRIIEARWLDESADGSVGSATLHDLAREFGVSAERIRQIEAKALRTMREELRQYA